MQTNTQRKGEKGNQDLRVYAYFFSSGCTICLHSNSLWFLSSSPSVCLLGANSRDRKSIKFRQDFRLKRSLIHTFTALTLVLSDLHVDGFLLERMGRKSSFTSLPGKDPLYILSRSMWWTRTFNLMTVWGWQRQSKRWKGRHFTPLFVFCIFIEFLASDCLCMRRKKERGAPEFDEKAKQRKRLERQEKGLQFSSLFDILHCIFFTCLQLLLSRWWWWSSSSSLSFLYSLLYSFFWKHPCCSGLLFLCRYHPLIHALERKGKRQSK